MSRIRSSFALLLTTVSLAASANTVPFAINGVGFKSDDTFYGYGLVIRCHSYPKNVEELPAAICCHYDHAPKDTHDQFAYTGPNWTCPTIHYHDQHGKKRYERGSLSYHCGNDIHTLSSQGDYYHSEATQINMVNFCRNKES